VHHTVVHLFASLSGYVMSPTCLSFITSKLAAKNVPKELTHQGMSASLTEKTILFVQLAKTPFWCLTVSSAGLLTTHLICGAVG
jgi:hypothetical protein